MVLVHVCHICFIEIWHFSLIKMLYWMCKESRGQPLTWPQMKHAIMRNFGGLKSDEVDPFETFCEQLDMADEELNPEDYKHVQEVTEHYFSSLLLLLYTLCIDRYGQSLIQTAQG